MAHCRLDLAPAPPSDRGKDRDDRQQQDGDTDREHQKRDHQADTKSRREDYADARLPGSRL